MHFPTESRCHPVLPTTTYCVQRTTTFAMRLAMDQSVIRAVNQTLYDTKNNPLCSMSLQTSWATAWLSIPTSNRTTRSSLLPRLLHRSSINPFLHRPTMQRNLAGQPIANDTQPFCREPIILFTPWTMMGYWGDASWRWGRPCFSTQRCYHSPCLPPLFVNHGPEP